jgi:hypothetical protein
VAYDAASSDAEAAGEDSKPQRDHVRGAIAGGVCIGVE